MMALLRYQDGYQGLIALGFKSVMAMFGVLLIMVLALMWIVLGGVA